MKLHPDAAFWGSDAVATAAKPVSGCDGRVLPAVPPPAPEISCGGFRSGCGIAGALLGLVLLFSQSGCSRPVQEFHALQAAVIQQSGCDWERQIRIGIPDGWFTLARLGLRLVALEPEVRAALETMRGLRVAIYERAHGMPDRAAMLGATAVLEDRGWERVLGVLEGDSFVSVLVPDHARPDGLLDLVVVISEGRQLLFVAGRADPGPLVELALHHLDHERRLSDRRENHPTVLASSHHSHQDPNREP